MERAATTGFGRFTEASDVSPHPDLTTLIEGADAGDSAVLKHIGACAQCRCELALHRVFRRCDEMAAPEDLAWIACRLPRIPWGPGPTLGMKIVYGAERVAALLLLLAVSPLVLFLALVIAALSQQAPFLRHARMGRGGNGFRMLKLRTMWGAAAKFEPARERKSALDPRVTSRVAAFCRRFSLDELPQLIHVASGRMSLVGPRPLTAAEFNRYYGSATAEVLSVKPGMTGLWQSAGRSRLTYAQRKRLDLFFVRHASPGLYVRILLKTIPRAAAGKDSW